MSAFPPTSVRRLLLLLSLLYSVLGVGVQS